MVYKRIWKRYHFNTEIFEMWHMAHLKKSRWALLSLWRYFTLRRHWTRTSPALSCFRSIYI